MSEKVYKTMKNVGAWNIAFGVLLIVGGITIGIIQLIHGKMETLWTVGARLHGIGSLFPIDSSSPIACLRY